MLQRDRGVERIADGVREPAVALEARRERRRALRMDEQHCAEFVRLGPDRMELGIGEVLAQHAAADRGALQPLLLHRGLELLHGEVGILQAERGKGRKAVRSCGAKLRELLVVELRRSWPRYRGPCRYQNGLIDSTSMSIAMASMPLRRVLDGDEMLLRALGRRDHVASLVAHQRDRLVEQAVRVHVDGPDALAVDLDRQSAAPVLRVCEVQHPAAAEHDPRRRRTFEKASSCGHAGYSRAGLC